MYPTVSRHRLSGPESSRFPLLQVTVLRAHNLPRLKSPLGKKSLFFATVTYGEKTWQTRSVRSVAQRVEWNENIEAFAVQPLSHMTLSLYVKRTTQNDILVGKQEIVCEPQRELDIIFSTEGHTRHQTEPITISLSITMSAAVDTVDPTADLDNVSAEGDRAEEAVTTIKTWKSAVYAIKRVMDIVSPIAALNPPARLAWSLFSKIPEPLLQQVKRDNNVQALFEEIRDSFELVQDPDTLRNITPESAQAAILEEMLGCISECAQFITSYAADVQVGKRALKNIVGQVDGKIEQYRTNLFRLREAFLAHAAFSTAAVVSDAELSAKIRELPYKGGWRFGDDRRCLPGTRDNFLNYIAKWVEDPKSKRGLVLLGQAGTGKSSIAHEVARRFDDKCLGSYFVFLRKNSFKDDAYQLFTTLARDLSDRYPAFKLALGRVIKDDSSLRNTRDYRALFEHLLLEPLRNLPLPGPVLLIVDALDESGATSSKNGLHTFLAQCLVDLPPNFRVLITSRLENDIERAFFEAPSVNILYMDDAELAVKTEQDIGVYLRHKLPPDLFENHGAHLVKASEGLFQWAAVACGFINSPPASFGFSKKKCIQYLLGHSRGRYGQDPLDKLYEQVLEEYFRPHEAQILFRSIMGQLFAAIEPLSIQSLVVLRRYAPFDDPEDSDPIPVLEVLRRLGSLLTNVTSSDQTRPIFPLHTSFRDFLTSEKSGAFYVDLDDAHRQLAHSCLGLMLENLKFNICELESSGLANSDVPSLHSRIAIHIPPSLSYACIFWASHLWRVAFEPKLFVNLRLLFETRFLFWLEVLSIKSSLGLVSPALSYLTTWLLSNQKKTLETEVENLLELIKDGSAFVRYFGMAMARSAPHIYISALPFAPISSHIFNRYSPIFPHILSLGRGGLSQWPALEMSIQAHDEPVCSVAFSPDGQRIASASQDRTIRVWDAITGNVVVGPFTGHMDWVLSVAFSPDGRRIASASRDCTIRVWDATTGEFIVGPFTGHTDSANSIAFSPDGMHIASAAGDSTICVWDATTGQVVAGPFTGHTGWINSLSFSPDGRRIASASDDCTIYVWDATTGDVVAGPISGHTDWINSVAWSPDGKRITSASRDCTIRVWDAVTGDVVADPFAGHTNWVNSVAFSPDGNRIVSASRDCTIRVWDATTGAIAAGPFTGHTKSINSVVFSPDGRRIASASTDHTIGVWDAAAGEVVADLLTGHTDQVFSVAFSPDGQRIASASRDRTIQVWDTATGDVTAGPFTGHTDDVNFVAFSPDGRCIASASDDCTIRVWDAKTGDVVVSPFSGHTDWVFSVAFSPDGRYIASASRDCTIRLWGAATGEVIAGPFTGHYAVNSLSFSPDGQHIASALDDCTIRVLDVTTGEVVAGPFTGHSDQIISVSFSPDGQHIASTSRDRTIRVWDATSGDVILGPFTGHTDSVNSVAFTPDGQHIASASNDHTIRVWDAATGDVVAGPFTGHTDRVFSVAFSPDGKFIASASGDCTIRMWDVATREEAGSSGYTKSVDSIPILPDGQRITSASRDQERVDVNTHFMKNFLINSDGWICGEDSELLLWIPHIHRPYFHRTNTLWIGGRHETWLDLENFVHGSNWATVYVPR